MMKKQALNSNQYAVLFAMKTVLETHKSRRWVLKKEIAAEFSIDTRTLTGVLSGLIKEGILTCRTLKNRQKGYSLCASQVGWLGVKSAKLHEKHPEKTKKQGAVNLYIYNQDKKEGDKKKKTESKEQVSAHHDKYLEAAAAYPHRLTGEKGLYEGEKQWNKLVGDHEEGGEGIDPDFIIAMIGRYAAMPIDPLYRKKWATFLRTKLFLDYAHQERTDEMLVADNPHVAVANITEILIEKFAQNDKVLKAAMDTIAFVHYDRPTNRLTLSFCAKDVPHAAVMTIHGFEKRYKRGLSEFYGVEIAKVKFAEL